MIKERKVLPFHCPTPLFNEMKSIAEENMMTVSSFCRMAVNHMVKDYNESRRKEEKLQEKRQIGNI
jgi:hypothetical protein